MPHKQRIHVGDIGTAVVVTIKEWNVTTEVFDVVDISTTTTKELFLKQPDGTVLTKTAAFTTDGTDGKMQFIAIAGDFPSLGCNYAIQGRVQFVAGDWKSSIEPFTVYENLA